MLKINFQVNFSSSTRCETAKINLHVNFRVVLALNLMPNPLLDLEGYAGAAIELGAFSLPLQATLST